MMHRRLSLVVVVFLVSALCAAADDVFIVKPYLQLGDAPRPAARERLEVRWETHSGAQRFEVQVSTGTTWSAPQAAIAQLVHRPEMPEVTSWRAPLEGLPPGAPFRYRVLRDGTEVFSAAGHARPSFGRPTRFVVYGDCGQDTPGERFVAYQSARLKPDFLFILGDVVYTHGRWGEYVTNFFPQLNADEASPTTGAPLLRSLLTLVSTGNHDTGNAREKDSGDLAEFPDGLAWYTEWSQPLNGPDNPCPTPIRGPAEREEAFRQAAGPRYPRMANYSFEYGNTHWTVLDSNPTVDWSNPRLREWVRRDLRSARTRWRIVAFHHPPFHSAIKHFKDQQMRVLSDIFQTCGVDVVLAGHSHTYQRSRPLRFWPTRQPDGAWRAKSGEVSGRFDIDWSYDGERDTRPVGPLYIVSGAGGATLQDPERESQRGQWQPYTVVMKTRIHSLTYIEAAEDELRFRQIDRNGREIDAFRITK